MKEIKANVILDAKGLSCPMPIVRTKKEMETLEDGQVLEVQATDPGSEADLKAWANSTGHQYLGTLKESELLRHFLRKTTTAETEEKTYDRVVNNEKLEEKINKNENIHLIDLREPAEYAFNHIPNTKNIPFGDLEKHIDDLNKKEEIYLICRTGNRSDLAAKQLTKLGFNHVYNIVPGMSEWTGRTEGIE